MYSKELEEFIELVLADGVITDKERQVLAKRALAEGIDPDELEVVVEGRLAKRMATQPVQPVQPAPPVRPVRPVRAVVPPPPPGKSKAGSVQKCPNCGASISAMTLYCEDCGYELQSRQGSSSVADFLFKLQEIDRMFPIQVGLANLRNTLTRSVSENANHKATLILNYPIPNTREALIEFATLCQSNMGWGSLNSQANVDEHTVTNAWRKKSKQIESKIALLMGTDPQGQEMIKSLKKERRKPSPQMKLLLWFVVPFLILMVGGFIAGIVAAFTE